ncbi:hypothetical protein [Kiloniella laminariae]|uniref:hypothetical protein n=1 Tax=Kiloniella laminariae TaxID=454162 RepID=UPI0003A2D166|nr:hypothetical protein [Kiloniella laminariae]
MDLRRFYSKAKPRDIYYTLVWVAVSALLIYLVESPVFTITASAFLILLALVDLILSCRGLKTLSKFLYQSVGVIFDLFPLLRWLLGKLKFLD